MPFLHVYPTAAVLPATKSEKNEALSSDCYLVPVELVLSSGNYEEFYVLVTESTGSTARVSQTFAARLGITGTEKATVSAKYLTVEADGEEREHHFDMEVQVANGDEIPTDYIELGWEQVTERFDLQQINGNPVFVLKRDSQFGCVPRKQTVST